MRKYKNILVRLLLIVLLIAPVGTWVFYKPIRILVPELNGITCINDHICVEDISKEEEAKSLYIKSHNFINIFVGKIKNNPKTIFCSSESCFESFGFQLPAKAKTIGSFGIVVSPKGWTEILLRHEMIHHLQVEKLGVIAQWRAPKWLKEGMAYSLSKDTRKLKEPWSGYRAKFESWYQGIDKLALWDEAKKI